MAQWTWLRNGCAVPVKGLIFGPNIQIVGRRMRKHSTITANQHGSFNDDDKTLMISCRVSSAFRFVSMWLNKPVPFLTDPIRAAAAATFLLPSLLRRLDSSYHY